MDDLTWDGSLSVQVEEIDEDHRRLIELFNILNRAVIDGETDDYVLAVVDELVSGTAWHFKHEERLMLKYGYSGITAHKAEHQELMESVKALQQQLLQEDRTVSTEVVQFLEQWLTGHILGADMEMGAVLAGEM